VIRLDDHAPGFADKLQPRGVIMTTAKLLDGTPTSGGKDYVKLGEGNDAYENFIENLTVDVGGGNPGAVGIDYLANNLGAIRDVRVTAPAGSGAVGIAMQRKWPGPALLQRVAVQGFAAGIAVANTEYGVTLDHVELSGQSAFGLVNHRNAISAAHLRIETDGTAIANMAPDGLVVLVDSELRRPGGRGEMLANAGTVVARGLALQGYPPPAEAADARRLHGTYSGARWRALPEGDPVALDDAPAPPADPVESWVNVLRFQPPGGAKDDITEALRRAFASGAATVYLPHGRYLIHDAIEVPATLRRIVGMNASLTVRPERVPTFARDQGMLRIRVSGPPLTIERVAFDMTDLGEQLAVELAAPRELVLRDIVTAGTGLIDRKAVGGRVFIEDTCCGPLRLAGPAPVIARQLDTEGGDIRILNEGAPFTVLGLKTEGNGVVIDNRAGARSTVLGGLVYVVRDADPAIPAFRNAGGTLRAAFVEESLRPASRYTIYVQGAGRDIRATEFPPRGSGRIVPWLVAGPDTGG
jgi:hypothetical protein